MLKGLSRGDGNGGGLAGAREESGRARLVRDHEAKDVGWSHLGRIGLELMITDAFDGI